MVWSQLDPNKTHVAYAVIGLFTVLFSLVSIIFKERLYISESTFASIYGLIVGPHCLNLFSPESWGNVEYITLEISRVVLVFQIFLGASELPKKYMLVHGYSVILLVVPVMTAGWLIVGAFIYLVMPGFTFPAALLVSGSITATDPVLAAAIIGRSKFAQKRVPDYIRNLLSAESGCNDGLAFPFVFLSLYLIIYAGDARKIVKDWFCVTILYQCVFGSFLGAIIGYLGRISMRFASNQRWIDKESFFSFSLFISFFCAGFSSVLGTDDLLVAFASGCAFSWDGWILTQLHETYVSSCLDLIINMAYFVYFGSIVPWDQFNNVEIGLNIWRLIIIAIVVLFLRRIPVVFALKPFVPDVRTWKQALFCGHFGPIGVGGIFACLVAKSELEKFVYGDNENGSQTNFVSARDSYSQLLKSIWPIVSFLVVVSIVVHGSSVSIIVTYSHLKKAFFPSENLVNVSGDKIVDKSDNIIEEVISNDKSDSIPI